ncbi:amidohydrolase family protein [Taklimakanibacter lacteus]|uniref:amidohydrolase family protein n=1 Tax=Taklimakanibacter lacteus TaxID=2268456 RepID=UPI000E673E60
MPKRVIVDAHHHLWDTTQHSYPWLSGPPYRPSIVGDVSQIAKNYLIDDLREDACAYDLRKTVHVDGGWDDPLAETTWLQELAEASDLPSAIVAGVKLHQPDIATQLEKHAAAGRLRGVRHILNWDPDPLLTFTDRPDYMTNRNWLAGYALLARHGLSFDLQIYPWQLAGAAELASRHPDTMAILNHAGMPYHARGASLESWRQGMRLLARNANTAVKISGLGMLDWKWTTQSIRPLVLETIDIFGVERCMFASNFPVDRLYSSFAQLYQSYEEIVADFTAGEQAQLFSANAERYYRI